jgi:hypothetical protein
MRLTAPGGARRLGHGAKVDEGHVEQPGRYRDGQGPPFRPEPDLTHGEQGQGEHPDYRKGGAVHPRPPWSGFEQTSPQEDCTSADIRGIPAGRRYHPAAGGEGREDGF